MADIAETEVSSVTIENGDGGTKLAVIADGSASVNLTDVAGVAVTLGQKAMAASMPVVIASDQTPINDLFGNVTFNGVSQSTVISTQGRATIQVYSIGTWSGSISFLGSVDGSTYFNILGYVPTGIISNGFTTNTSFTVQCGGYLTVKIITSAWTSGTAVVYWDSSIALNPNLQSTFRMIDFSGNGISSQANGAQRALDVGIDVAGVQIDPRQIRALTSSDTVTVVQPTGTNLHTVVDSSALPTGASTAALQTAGNASLAAIDAGIPAALGQTTMANSMPVTLASDQTIIVKPVSLWVTGTAGTGVALTATLPLVASQFHYISSIEIMAYSTAARTGGATPIIVTTTNLPGNPAWTFATAAAIGTTDTKFFTYNSPVKSAVVGTATTIVCPATTGVIWRINVNYFTGV
jgi:hypothetical protein